MTNVIQKILNLFCCSSFRSTCCEKEDTVESNGQSHHHKELVNIEYTNKASSYFFECGNNKICLFKCSKVINPT